MMMRDIEYEHELAESRLPIGQLGTKSETDAALTAFEF